ncbi:ArfX, unspecified Arf protein [Monocercomonoides exilis]|uniref:ArfX, unspecified Arf protein n=1 Tax=Monocercomonoides exilis TaxID=2049356 RepID=UPI00355A8524|nr:ArfX, unspecified Arf protein [Monocercomonoides exilis]|eukprot:MONOS_6934.1-p1 / transcript=MONOS_6934.1 / gene=MONOS_6934 / organism=Monocercomonoides_exilis_PA203 / gene_product=ArfX, unspecified Arf protein / transcript_product=ArfX, unspecified Arf protein / location=Mono_scaffold00228:5408-5959(+) / protein_length=184 / sequence_SO=supercontig / SO=protein_coding / is_pseudo=false
MGCCCGNQFKKKEFNILIVGLDNAGKTSIVQRITENPAALQPTLSTIGSQVKEYKFQKTKFSLWDVGGQEELRNTWKHYYVGTNGIIFVIDSADDTRFAEAKKEFEKVVSNSFVSNLPCLFLCNKCDLPGACSPAALKEKFDLQEYEKKNEELFRIEGCSAVTGEGLKDGLAWLSEKMPKKEN